MLDVISLRSSWRLLGSGLNKGTIGISFIVSLTTFGKALRNPDPNRRCSRAVVFATCVIRPRAPAQCMRQAINEDVHCLSHALLHASACPEEKHPAAIAAPIGILDKKRRRL